MIPKRYKNIEPDSRTRDLADKEQSVLLIGKTGVGKTYFAATIYNAFSGSKMFFDASEYLAEWTRRKWLRTTDAHERQEGWKESAIKPKLLVIDDLGMEQKTEANAAIVRLIIGHRYNDKMMTIITTNLSGKELEERYSARLISRVYEDYLVVVMKGKDRRREKMGKVINLS